MVGDTVLLLMNAHHEAIPFTLPATQEGQQWERLLDTVESQSMPLECTGGQPYELQGRSMAVLRIKSTAGRRRHTPSSRGESHAGSSPSLPGSRRAGHCWPCAASLSRHIVCNFTPASRFGMPCRSCRICMTWALPTSMPRRFYKRGPGAPMAMTLPATRPSIQRSALRRTTRSFCQTLQSHDMGQVLDIVPNHMGVAGNDNLWWRDVLKTVRPHPMQASLTLPGMTRSARRCMTRCCSPSWGSLRRGAGIPGNPPPVCCRHLYHALF